MGLVRVVAIALVLAAALLGLAHSSSPPEANAAAADPAAIGFPHAEARAVEGHTSFVTLDIGG